MVAAVDAYPGITLVSLLATSMLGAFKVSTNIPVKGLELVIVG